MRFLVRSRLLTEDEMVQLRRSPDGPGSIQQRAAQRDRVPRTFGPGRPPRRCRRLHCSRGSAARRGAYLREDTMKTMEDLLGGHPFFAGLGAERDGAHRGLRVQRAFRRGRLHLQAREKRPTSST